MDTLGSFTITEAHPALTRSTPANVLTVDLEDWYQGLEIPCCEWSGFEDRLEPTIATTLMILAESGAKATFFALGKIAEKSPGVVRMIADAGHEIGTHGYSHSLIFKMRPRDFADELDRSVKLLEDITGKRVLGHRAAYFSINADSLWALDVIAQQGLVYDSSIFPIRHYRYRCSNTPKHPYVLENATGRLIEFPISTLSVVGRSLPMFGGFYLRFFPRALVRRGVELINSQDHPVVMYFHPWELDPKHPRIRLPFRLGFPHYWRLGSTRGKLASLLRRFKFEPACSLIPSMQDAVLAI